MLVSAAYLDNLFNGTSYRTDANDEEDERKSTVMDSCTRSCAQTQP